METLFQGEEINSKNDKEDLLWILSHLIPIVVGKRWIPTGKIVAKDKHKCSFFGNVSASDVGFCYYLLEYYSPSALHYKDENEKKRRNPWNKDSHLESVDFYSKNSKRVKDLFLRYGKEEKDEIDARVLAVLREGLEDKESPLLDSNNYDVIDEEEGHEVFAESTFFELEEV